MKLVLLTALGVGGATVIGALVGFLFKKVSHKFSDIVLSFAEGVSEKDIYMCYDDRAGRGSWNAYRIFCRKHLRNDLTLCLCRRHNAV